MLQKLVFSPQVFNNYMKLQEVIHCLGYNMLMVLSCTIVIPIPHEAYSQYLDPLSGAWEV